MMYCATFLRKGGNKQTNPKKSVMNPGVSSKAPHEQLTWHHAGYSTANQTLQLDLVPRAHHTSADGGFPPQ